MDLKWKTLVGVILMSCVSAPSYAQQYRFTYSKLYSQAKYNLEEAYKDVKVAYFFVDADTKKRCTIEKAWMEKEEHYEEFTIPKSQELNFPLDQNLKQANPLVFVNLPQDMRCDFSMVVMTKAPLSTQLSYGQAKDISMQMDALYAELVGMFGQSPDVIGLTLEFEGLESGQILVSDQNPIEIKKGRAQIDLSTLTENSVLQLPQETSRVLPLVKV